MTGYSSKTHLEALRISRFTPRGLTADDIRVVAPKPTQEALDAAEEYYIGRYLEDHGIDGIC